MTEYIIRVDENDERWEYVKQQYTHFFRYPIADEVVRCKDCKYASEVYWPENSGIANDYLDCHGELVEPWDYYYDEPKYNPVRPDGFCAWGKRREP